MARFLGFVVCVIFVDMAVGVELTRDGKPAATIVLPESTLYDALLESEPARHAEEIRKLTPEVTDAEMKVKTKRRMRAVAKADDEEKLAADELREFVKKMSGAELPVATVASGAELPTGNLILLGPELARTEGLEEEIDALPRHGFVVRTDGNRIYVTGADARGTLFGAYTLLEQLGVRWVMPGPFGEMYPEEKNLSFDGDISDAPGHKERYFWPTYGSTDDYPRWTLRNKGNFVRAHDEPKVEQGHGLSKAIRWGKLQPEYGTQTTKTETRVRKQPDGSTKEEEVEKTTGELDEDLLAVTRGDINPVLPNVSNPRAWEMYAEYIKDYFRQNPSRAYATLSAEDGIMLDQRPESIAFSSNEFDWTYGAFSSTDQLWHFHNRVLDLVGEEFPDKKFGILVYANNQMPPRMEKLHPNMALIFAPLGISPLTHVRDENEKTNRAWREWLEDWMRLARASGAETYYYDYEPIGFSWNLAMICPRWEIIGRNYPYFHDLGLDGHTSQGHDDWAASGLNNYVMQRLYWDPDEDYKEIIRDYCRARFDGAAEEMFAYYELLGEAPMRTPALYGNEHWANHLVLTPELRREARQQLQKAAAAADTDRAREQVAAMMEVQEMTDAMCDAIEVAAETGDFGAGAAKMEEAFAVKDKLNDIYPNFVNEKRMDPESTRPFETGGQYNLFKQFAERIKDAKTSLPLPRVWKGALDTGQAAFADGLYLPEADVSGLDDLDTTIMPDVKYETQREPAAFFYRTEVDVPKSFANKKAVLFFPGLIAQGLEVWVNGEAVIFDNDGFPETIYRGPRRFWMGYDTVEEVDVTELLKPGEKNTIAFRAFKSADVGGSFRRIFLLAD